MKSTATYARVAVSQINRWSANNGAQQQMTGSELTKSHEETTSEQLLQASRRLDWRFLLPNPSLQRVAYFGPTDSSLLTSLRLFATTLSICPAGRSASQEMQYDVVIACEPAPAALRQAVSLVEAGGSLYVEAHGLLWPEKWRRPANLLRQPRLWQPTDYIRAIQTWGLSEVEAFWFWPNVENCTKIVPLNNQVVLPYAFGTQTQPRGAKARLKAAYKRWLVQSGWLTLTLPNFGIVAH